MASICVFCGARAGRADHYTETAEDVGRWLAQAGHRLVYGAGDVGLMGSVARACQQAGGDTFGVIPSHLLDLEVGKRDLTRFIMTETMHERKKVMFANSDAILVLPGGAGSLDEFFEVLTWRQLGLHSKPILLLSDQGYWAPLVSLVEHVIAQGFADSSLRGFFTVCADLAEVEEKLAAFSSR